MNITNDEVFFVQYDEESDKIVYKTKRKFENKIVEYFRTNKLVFSLTILSTIIGAIEIYLTFKFFSIAGSLIK